MKIIIRCLRRRILKIRIRNIVTYEEGENVTKEKDNDDDNEKEKKNKNKDKNSDCDDDVNKERDYANDAQ